MSDRLFVTSRKGVNVIFYKSIVYMENDRRKVIVHTLDNTYEFYGKLTQTMEELDDRFYQCHRSYVINFDMVKRMDEGNKEILFINKESIFLGRDTFAKTKKAFEKYIYSTSKKN